MYVMKFILRPDDIHLYSYFSIQGVKEYLTPLFTGLGVMHS